MTTKRCPYCAEEIQIEAVKCKHCGSWLDASPGAVAGAAPPAGTHVTEASRRLAKATHDRMFWGVCGGIAHYLGIDSTLVRVVYASASLFTAGFPGVLLYILLGFIMPDDPTI